MNGELENKSRMEGVVETYKKKVLWTAHDFLNLRIMYYDRWLHEDLVQQGYLGLIEAYMKYNSNKGPFWQYARKFVKGKMVDFTVKYFNYIIPSKKVNEIMLKIKRQDLMRYSPKYISNLLGCTEKQAAEAMHFIIIKRTLYLFDSCNNNNEQQEKSYVIDTLILENDQKDITSNNELSVLDRKVAQMFIDDYSRENILEYCGITATQLKASIDRILEWCEIDEQKIQNRNEDLLLKLSNLEGDNRDEKSAEEKNLEWVNIDLISASPRNPRKDLSINIENMQETLITKGFEEPLTCYRMGEYFVLLAGHRRWYAAKKMGSAKLPVFIVKRPENSAEEKDRLGSLQSAQVEWTPYEIAKNTYDRWVYAGGIAYRDLSKKMGVPTGKIESRIRVYKYYPRKEIEEKLANGMYSITMLDYIQKWIKRLCQCHPTFLESIGEEFIRQQMLTKYENRCFNSSIANDRNFVYNATSEEIFSFISDTNKTLRQAELEMTMNQLKRKRDINKIHSMLDKSMSFIKKIEWIDRNEAQQLLDETNTLLVKISKRKNDLLGGN
ncbi:ParB N-terminal domain-containing protein [Paenibacillus aceti]|uniref:ParB-like N-terminal domain-containing protein n=1 Tax=Paenibacillus aceti TaxID=1820010 RepID=A0ABQ1W7R2_9BACL|nr:ParB N-terminal domain-containing protein [Paenibacillus aceti]GGG17608.1 hypothetical protein GCM10010913_44630 [Paenibacillus aceti]